MATVTFDPDCSMDLNLELIKRPASTFFMRAAGTSMTGAGIYPEDILIVDRSLEATDRKVIIAIVNGELTVKRLRLKDGRAFLVAENEGYPPIEITGHMEFAVWGVVTYVVHSV
ncbi:LexA family protein [Desulfoluna butyratoxydans]|uniref:Peptidase s24/s26a/s26b/s26c n=1 Tax=Desulfoluna butyratoxydans TaxID=231438 RepID=A0A4U8YTC3_9BACT|nr:translesion error-prone DNA polymerase V autoproteolytic subunit [Desulfoluna butyratoxydans]VFQ47230.1 peptidase s24/s26a/s26b/s26c [Desulfoluna butyratoxydans]